RADRAPGRGRAGACSSSRLGTRRPLFSELVGRFFQTILFTSRRLALFLHDVAEVVDVGTLWGQVAADDAGGVERQRGGLIVEDAAALQTGRVAGDAGVLDERVAVVVVEAASLGGGGVAGDGTAAERD